MTAVEYNHKALGKYWFLRDIPKQWDGYDVLAQGDYDKDKDVEGDERYAVNWVDFTSAVMSAQTEMGITSDGMLGPNTLRSLQNRYMEVRPEEPSNTISFTTRITTVGNVVFNRPEEPTASPSNQIVGRNYFEKVIANMWNNYGAAIVSEGNKYGIPIQTALAVFCVESKQAYDPKTGLVIIRYEPHIFTRKSGKTVSASRGGQSAEWINIKRAAEVDEEAAFLATSFGLPQLMGFNWEVTGLRSVFEVATEFQRSCRVQVKGFFDFVEKNNLTKYVLRGDWSTFTRYYNGPGQVEYYSGELRKALSVVNGMNIGV